MHTYLLEEATWQAEGVYLLADERTSPVTGWSRVTHEAARWVLEGQMRLGGPDAVQSENRYQIAPLAPGRAVTAWHSHSPALGRLEGTFPFIGEFIVSAHATPDLYRSAGVLFEGRLRLGAWTVRLCTSG